MSIRLIDCLLPCLILSLSACNQARDGGDARAPRVPLSAAVETAADGITAGFIKEMVETLASDRMEGRDPGTRGDRSARLALTEELRELGLEPGAPGGAWEQPFPIVGLSAALPEQWSFAGADGQELAFEWWDEYVAGSGVQRPAVAIEDSEVVFVGYGIDAPEEEWDDFKGANLKGKILLMLNNDPDWDPELFGGVRRLYYGRWTYKYESAASQGAAGAIIIHTTPSAGYPWQVVQTSWSGEQFELPAGGEPRVGIQAWLTDEAAGRLVKMAGRDLDDLVAAARRRDFRPVPLGITTSIRFTTKVSRTETANVAGLLRGSDPELRNEVVIFSAHHDHLGIGKPDSTGDKIYNGALDNGVAMAQALAVARAMMALPEPPRRSVLFLFVGGEEQGLLGSRYFAAHPTSPREKIAANINFELGNIWGRTRDVAIFGRGKSTLEDILESVAARQGRVVVGEASPDAGWYYRSDQFSFARIGVPAIWFRSGTDVIGRPAGWGQERMLEWISQRYHQPCDELDETWDFEGLVEDARLAFFLGLEVAGANEPPGWYPGDEFEDVR
ncbi:MAG: M28 family peptidase [Planctomycetota bacterium]